MPFTNCCARILNAHWHLEEGCLTPGNHRLQRQIDATGIEINRLVYDIYGLTEEEINLIEQ